MTAHIGGLARGLVRRRWWVIAVWLALFAGLLPFARHAGDRLEVANRIEGSESEAVEQALATRFESPFARSVVLVLTGVPAPDSEGGRALLGEVGAVIQAVPGVTRTGSYRDFPDPLLRGEGGAIMLVGLDLEAPPDIVVQRLREAMRPIAARLHARHPGSTLRLTGTPALNFDLRRASSAEVRAAEARALPLTAALLLLAFGAVGAALLPVAAGVLAIGIAMGAAVALTRVWPLSVSLESVVSMLGLGLGIDYALLMVSRFREARVAGRSPFAAAEEAAVQAGRTVAVSALAVAIGFLGLLLVPLAELRSVAAGGLLVVVASALLATTLLPALLAVLCDRLEALRLPWPAWRGDAHWRRWGARVAARPGLVLLLFGTPLLLLALQARRLNTELPRGDWLPLSMESAQALFDLRQMGRSGLVQELLVVLELPEDTISTSAAGWAAARRLEERLTADPRVARVRSLRSFAGEQADDLAYLALLPSFLKRCYLSAGADAVLIEVIPGEGREAAELTRFARELRRADAAEITGLPGARLRVGGLPGFNADYEDAVAGRLPLVVGLVVAGTWLALLLGFRSLLAPLKAVALNLLSVAGAFGAVVLVFQEGHGARWLGLPGATGSVFPAVPILVFGIVFGLSMDYEVFLVARVAEARRAGAGESGAVVEGLARTGGVITSAAAIMVAVFAAFTVGGSLLVQMLGFALAVAVLLDATVVRLALGPALLRLAGRWNWWPGRLPAPAACVPNTGVRVPVSTLQEPADSATP